MDEFEIFQKRRAMSAKDYPIGEKTAQPITEVKSENLKFSALRALQVLKQVRDMDAILLAEFKEDTGEEKREARWEAVMEEVREEIKTLEKEILI